MLAPAPPGNPHGSLAHGNGAIALSGSGVSLAYGDLVVTDELGRTLPADFALHGRVVSIVADVAGASYLVRIDPVVQQAKLTSSDPGRCVRLRAERLVPDQPGEAVRDRRRSPGRFPALGGALGQHDVVGHHVGHIRHRLGQAPRAAAAAHAARNGLI
jgi:hypothetical protein